MTSSRDYYCNLKFRFLKVDLERKLTYNCDVAASHKIDLDWLTKNPGQIFNTDINTHERGLMLQNIRNRSCEQNCWKAEDVGAAGPRILRKGYEKSHIEIKTSPEIIDLTLSSDCNLTCTYCCKEVSSAWRQDIANGGSYPHADDPQRYKISTEDMLIGRASQKEKFSSRYYQTMLRELEFLAPSTKLIIITGGEPLLNNSLFEILDRVKSSNRIKIFTGLGVSEKRFETIVKKLTNYPNLYLCVSVENIGELYQFNRYGNSWKDVESKIQLLIDTGIETQMHSVLSNLTIFGFPDFYLRYKNRFTIQFDLAYNPTFMPIYVMDECSKQQVRQSFADLDLPGKDLILQSLSANPAARQTHELGAFLKEFINRRPTLDLSVFPETFVKWVENSVV